MEYFVGIVQVGPFIRQTCLHRDVGLQPFGQRGSITQLDVSGGDAEFFAVAQRKLLENFGLSRGRAAEDQSNVLLAQRGGQALCRAGRLGID